IRSDIPGAVDAIRAFVSRGFRIHTASGTISAQLDATLTAMGVRDCFGPRLYGPDLVDVPKGGPAYYRRTFDDAGIDPAEAIVLDDSADACTWAESLGARAVRLAPDTRFPDLATFAPAFIAEHV